MKNSKKWILSILLLVVIMVTAIIECYTHKKVWSYLDINMFCLLAIEGGVNYKFLKKENNNQKWLWLIRGIVLIVMIVSLLYRLKMF